VSSPGARLRALLAGPDTIVIPESYDALSARLVAEHRFAATYCGGGVLSAMALGLEDNGLVTTTELIRMAGQIAASVDLPVISDADQGGETVLNVRRTVRGFEAAGIAGIHLEDSLNPKHLGGRNPLRVLDEMCARLSVACEARRNDDFVIIGRTDALREGCPLDVAIERGRAYAAAGADAFMCVFIPPPDLAQVTREIPIPVIDINQPLGAARAAGLRLDLFAGHAQHFTAGLQDEVLRQLENHGELSGMYYRKLSRDRLARLLQNGPSRSLTSNAGVS
jgi:2-methylisocitrate lyase-like PEP mutase family enzyme